MNKLFFTASRGYHYIAYLPEDPFASEKKWPLLLYLHGVDERGNDLKLVAKAGLPQLLESRKNFPFLTVAPQCPEKEFWVPSMVDELIDAVGENYRVDYDRVCLTGISMGGYGAWMTAINYPDRFAAIVPICGGGDSSKAALIGNLPVWAFHGAKDTVVPLSESEQMVNALRRAGGNVQLTVYPEGGHDVWTEAYNTKELYEWLLSRNRKTQALKKIAS